MAGSCELGNEPLGSIKILEIISICVTGGCSRRAQLHVVSYCTHTFHLVIEYGTT
jgi:hypothetical protein